MSRTVNTRPVDESSLYFSEAHRRQGYSCHIESIADAPTLDYYVAKGADNQGSQDQEQQAEETIVGEYHCSTNKIAVV